LTKPTKIVPSHAEVDEEPVSHQERNSVYWIDIFGGKVDRSSLDGEALETFVVPEPVGYRYFPKKRWLSGLPGFRVDEL